ncbi:MAG TPA: hypothetical protein PKD03_15015 [Ignavibacteriaceae bacterium]|nr:hypothetical protein [Ignavibacteriaceae bacterium]
MKRILGLLALSLLTFSVCNKNAEESNKQQIQEGTMKQLRIVRHFVVKPETVYRASTNPEDMIVWWDTRHKV